MLGVQFIKVDPTTHIIQTVAGKVKRQGKGLSFYYFSPRTSLTAIPVNANEVPFIFSLQTADFQEIRVQGQLTYRVAKPEVLAGMLNFTLKEDGKSYASDDPMTLPDRLVRVAQSIVQEHVQSTTLRNALTMIRSLEASLSVALAENSHIENLGMEVLNSSIISIVPTPETGKALEAEAREQLLKEADDAIYSRRKSAVEQERTIKEAELQTEKAIQAKKQEIATANLDNQRELQQKRFEAKAESLKAETEAEKRRKELVDSEVVNTKTKADAEAYATEIRLKAYQVIPVEYHKAMAMAKMQPDQLLASAMDSFANNADKVGQLNISPDWLGQLSRQPEKATWSPKEKRGT